MSEFELESEFEFELPSSFLWTLFGTFFVTIGFVVESEFESDESVTIGSVLDSESELESESELLKLLLFGTLLVTMGSFVD